MRFQEIEVATGVRMSFNTIPSTKSHMDKFGVPLAIEYSPLAANPEQIHQTAPPGRYCTKCSCLISFYSKPPRWTCHFCKTINETRVEGIGKFFFEEYVVKTGQETGLLFVVDVSLPQKQLNALVCSLKQLLPLLPRNIYVGLVSYNKNIYLHNLASELPAVTAVDGLGKENPTLLANLLKGNSYDEAKRRYFMPLAYVQDRLQFQLDMLSGEAEAQGLRPERATGQALNTAAAFCQMFPQVNIRVALLVGGACTVGEGRVVGLSVAQTFRSFNDFKEQNQNCKYMKAATEFYSSLKKVFIFRNAVVDIFSYGLDQFGLFEMRDLITKTGGLLAMQESFDSPMFQNTILKHYRATEEGLFRFGMCGRIKLFLNAGLKIQGAIGNCQSLQDKSPMAILEGGISECQTSEWYMGSLQPNSTITIFLQHGKEIGQLNRQKNAIFQLRTIFKYSDNKIRQRVVSFHREFAPQAMKREIVSNFDQEAMTAVLSKLCSYKAETEEYMQVIKFLDRSMFRLMHSSCDFHKNDKSSVRIPDRMKLFPQMIYHLRRSHFINTFGTSPDQILFYKASLYRENVENCCTMVLPTLLEYRVQNALPQPVKLNLESMQDNVILLLDCYFYVVVWEGKNVHDWKLQGLHQTEDYQYLAEFFERPLHEVAEIMEERLPTPTKYFSFFGDGKERYIKSRVNPASGGQQSENCLSEDVSLKVFMDYLLRTIACSEL